MTSIRDQFDFRSGSVPGRHHLGRHPNIQGLNNQDACGRRVTEDYAILVISDGCGSGDHSEFGSRLLITSTLNAFVHVLENPVRGIERFGKRWRGIAYQLILCDLREVTETLIEMRTLSERDNFVASHLLATLVVAVVTPDVTVILTIGDGVYAENGKVTVVDSGVDNTPAYVAYGLMGGSVQAPPASFRFAEHLAMPTASIDTLLIGSDGLNDVIAKAEHAMPGKPGEIVGPLSWFWSDKAFKNSVAVERRLRLVNREVVRARPGGGITTDRGLLDDDTTLIVMRRKA